MAKQSGIRFTIRSVITALGGAIVESANAVETGARSVHKSVSMAEKAIDQMIAEQEREIAEELAKLESKAD